MAGTTRNYREYEICVGYSSIIFIEAPGERGILVQIYDDQEDVKPNLESASLYPTLHAAIAEVLKGWSHADQELILPDLVHGIADLLQWWRVA
jgi:hypothetical protein